MSLRCWISWAWYSAISRVRSSNVLGSGSEGREVLVVEGCEVVVVEGKEGYFLRMDFICCGVDVDVAIVKIGQRSEGVVNSALRASEAACLELLWRSLRKAIGVVLPSSLKRQRAFSR